MWSRVYCPVRDEPAPAALVEHLIAAGLAVIPHFKGDDLGWTSGELHLPAGGTPILMSRFLTKEDELRADLNAHAAELETQTYSPNHGMLMERVIQTLQLITLRRPIDASDESRVDRICETVCQWICSQFGAVYQVDGRGWFSADGTELLHEY